MNDRYSKGLFAGPFRVSPQYLQSLIQQGFCCRVERTVMPWETLLCLCIAPSGKEQNIKMEKKAYCQTYFMKSGRILILIKKMAPGNKQPSLLVSQDILGSRQNTPAH